MRAMDEEAPVSSYRIGILHGNLEQHHVDRVELPVRHSAAPPRPLSSLPPSSERVTPGNAMRRLRELELVFPRAAALYRRERGLGFSEPEAVAEVERRIRQTPR